MSSFKSSICSTRLAPSDHKHSNAAPISMKEFQIVKPLSPPASVKVSSVASDDGSEVVDTRVGPIEDWEGGYKFAPIKVSQLSVSISVSILCSIVHRNTTSRGP